MIKNSDLKIFHTPIPNGYNIHRLILLYTSIAVVGLLLLSSNSSTTHPGNLLICAALPWSSLMQLDFPKNFTTNLPEVANFTFRQTLVEHEQVGLIGTKQRFIVTY